MKSKIQKLMVPNQSNQSKNNNSSSFVKKFLLLATLVLLNLTVQAQDKKAKELLDQVSAKVKSYNSIVIDFKYSLNNAKENINQDSKGNVTHGFPWIITFITLLFLLFFL